MLKKLGDGRGADEMVGSSESASIRPWMSAGSELVRQQKVRLKRRLDFDVLNWGKCSGCLAS
jgi:hypothetical protein